MSSKMFNTYLNAMPDIKISNDDQLKEDSIFDLLKDENEKLNIGNFFYTLSETGIKIKDPRLKNMLSKLKVMLKKTKSSGGLEGLTLDRDQFKSVIEDNAVLIYNALKQRLVIPEFNEFCKLIDEIHTKCKANTGGKVADYIPSLAKFSINPEYWGVSICTVDGQRYSIGDTEIPFTIQSSGKPISYAIALSCLGADVVHKYIGHEPSGRMFNELVLDQNRKPHNPMVNAGAIIVCSLLMYLIEPEMSQSEKFDWVSNYFKSMCGGEYLAFNNGTFLSEREAADRNYSIGYYMKENKCFPKKAVLKDVMDFYFEICSLEVNCESVSVMASTLANGGICPITDQQVITTSSVRDCLSLMHSCGMYDYSGQFAFSVGLPTKSGVSGCMMIVVPNVMGICCWSPCLDSYGNSVRGVEFCEDLVDVFNFHHYDNLRHSVYKIDPRKFNFTDAHEIDPKSAVIFAKRASIAERLPPMQRTISMVAKQAEAETEVAKTEAFDELKVLAKTVAEVESKLVTKTETTIESKVLAKKEAEKKVEEDEGCKCNIL